MSRLLSLGLIGFLLAALVVLPGSSSPSFDAEPPLVPSTFTVCVADEAVGRTTEISAAATETGNVQLTLFANGQVAGSMGVGTGDEGTTVLPIIDVAAVGTVGGLVELPVATGAAASLIRGVGSFAAEACVGEASDQLYLTGGRTAGPDNFTLQLMNPFATDAVVRLVVTSEVGIESNERFNQMVVPSMTSVILEMSEFTPGRERLSVFIETTVGRIAAVGRQTGPDDSAMWNAVEPAMDWFVPVPSDGDDQMVLVGNPSLSDVEYQVDVFGSEATGTAVITDSLEGGGQHTIDIAAIEEFGEVHAVRVIATTPLVAGLWSVSEAGVGASHGATTEANLWLVPGALQPAPEPPEEGEEDAEDADEDEGNGGPVGESGRLVIFNPGLEDATVTVTGLGNGLDPTSVDLPAEGTVEVEIGTGDAHLIESAIPVVVLWVAESEQGRAVAIGTPVDG